MKHRTVEKQLEKYLAGELSPIKERRIEEHLSICLECTKKLEEILEFEVELINLFHTAGCPRNLEVEINQAIAQLPLPKHIPTSPLARQVPVTPGKQHSYLPLAIPVAIAAAVMALIFGGLYTLYPHMQKDISPRANTTGKTTSPSVEPKDVASESSREKQPHLESYRSLLVTSLDYGHQSDENKSNKEQ